TQSGSVHQSRKNRACFARFCVHMYVLVSPPSPPPRSALHGQRPAVCFPLDHGRSAIPALRSLFPPPAPRPAPAGRPKSGVYHATVVVRRSASLHSIASTVERGAALARRGRGLQR